MRKREPDTATIIPHPCDHPPVTWQGASAPACLWGSTETLALPDAYQRGPEALAMDAARHEHFYAVGTRSFPRDDLLAPDGSPWKSRPLWCSVAPDYAHR